MEMVLVPATLARTRIYTCPLEDLPCREQILLKTIYS